MAEGCNLYISDSDLYQIENFILGRTIEQRNYIEVEKRISEAYYTIPDGRERTKFGGVVGLDEHKLWEGEKRRQERAKGRIEVKTGMDPSEGDFAIEYGILHPDGSKCQYDYVDFKNDIIIDRKPQYSQTSDAELAEEWTKKMNKYAEAYFDKFGRIPKVYLSPYPSTKDLFPDS